MSTYLVIFTDGFRTDVEAKTNDMVNLWEVVQENGWEVAHGPIIHVVETVRENA